MVKTLNIPLEERDHQNMTVLKHRLGIGSWRDLLLKGTAALIRERERET